MKIKKGTKLTIPDYGEVIVEEVRQGIIYFKLPDGSREHIREEEL